MPKRDDISTILVIGSGPIVIGQGCEFDYSGAQACKSLRDEGYRVVLVNSNPATIMTDPAMADRTYVEPIVPEAVEKIILKEASLGTPIDAVLPTLGGQTALNCACALHDAGTFDRHGVEMIGAVREVIHKAEDRAAFKDVCNAVNLRTPDSGTANTLEEGKALLEKFGLPAIIRPAFTLGGWGGGVAYNLEEFEELVTRGINASMISQVQVDKSLLGWKEYELEVVRDKHDNCVIVCGIENIDAMGVHTGDSVTVAPILTLTDKEYQVLRDASIEIMRAVGVETGGSNVQFAVNPNPEPGPDGQRPFEFVVVEMNPRVSRSSALASKATGFPIAKIAAKLAVGYTLDELRNDITGTTSACFEPSIDYVVTKMPRWTFEKFPEADETLTTQMKSVGEAMAIGRTFKESLQKVIRSMDVKRFGLGLDKNDKWLAAVRAVERAKTSAEEANAPETEGESRLGPRTADGQKLEWPIDLDKLVRKLAVPSQGRLYYVRYALKMGWSIERVHEHTSIDPFFLDQIAQLVAFEDQLFKYTTLEDVPKDVLFRAKQLGYSDAQLAYVYLGSITSEAILRVRRHREAMGVAPVFKLVDTCAAEFEAVTPYYYSTYQPGWTEMVGEDAIEHPPEDEIGGDPSKEKVIIIGGGPNRIGQGIEFDYCCVHAAQAANELGFESVMINSNPETVSTDYDTSDMLFFEPLTLEDTLNVIERLNARPGLRFLDPIPEGDFLGAFGGLSATQAETKIGRQAAALGIANGLVVDVTSIAADGVVAVLRADVLEPDDRVTTLEIDPLSDTCRVAGVSRPWSAFAAETHDEGAAKVFRDRVDDDLAKNPGPVRGVIVQFGGQTPLNLAHGLAEAGVPLIGTNLESIDLAEDREQFDDLLTRLDLQRPAGAIAYSLEEARLKAAAVGYPVLVRPSYVLGGRGMEICNDEKALVHYMTSALDVSDLDGAPVLIDQFLDGAIEIDVDVVADGSGEALVCAVMEHIEHAGVHSGDSTCVVPPFSLAPSMVERLRETARSLARELKVCGLMNAQLAVKDDEIYVIEVNPRASRTVPFVGKAKSMPWAKAAARAMLGVSLAEQGVTEKPSTGTYAVKAPVFPFQKFPGVDFVLGPEMRSTGEVMGVDVSLPNAYLKALLAAGTKLPSEGGVFISVRSADKPAVIDAARSLLAMGFTVYTTTGTAELMNRHGLEPEVLQKVNSGVRPNVIDLMSDGQISLIINTPTRTGWNTDEGKIRATAVRLGIPMLTTVTAADAAVRAIQAQKAGVWGVAALQDLDQGSAGAESALPAVHAD
ncbi:MAG: carbamoyl-phosphate synthase large subunit [Planctomycetota bacterium]